MENNKYNKIEAFVFKLWKRDISENQLSEKEKETLNVWKVYAEKEIDKEHLLEAKSRVLSAIEPHFYSNRNGKHISVFRKYVYQSAAVILLLFSIGGFYTYNTFIKPDVYVAKSGNHKITLKDGSVITLLPGAQLTVEKSFPADTREVFLKGDAIFSVAKSKTHPFIVKADGFSTKVLGTVFKVSQSGASKSVDLYEGKVAVSYPGTEVSYLKPNQQWTNFGIKHTSAVITQKKDMSTSDTKTLLSLSFNDVQLDEAASVLEKSYGFEIEYPQDLAAKKITADLTGADYMVNIEAVAFIMGLQVVKDDNRIMLKK